MREVLRAEAVDVVREGKPILQEVSLSVRAGEHRALLGANGAGKSTLLSLLGALVHPTRGTVEVLGANGAGKSTLLSLLGALVHPTRGTVEVLGRRLGRVDLRELRAYVGHVDPRHPLRSPLRVREVVLTGLTNSVEPLPRWRAAPGQEERAERLIRTLGLTEHRDSRWPTLSQGQRTRTLIARALMPEPGLLLLDEPATGLDLPGRERLSEALDELRRAHPRPATVLVTHHLEELPPGTTHALLLREGRALAQGPVAGVLTGHRVGKCFDLPLSLGRQGGRWTVSIRRRT